MNQKAPAKIKPLYWIAALLVALPTIFYVLYTGIDKITITSHGFSFGDVNGQENKGILILDYRYGNNKMIPSRPAHWQLREGKVPQFNNIYTYDSPADSLYVKWRVLATGKEYEDMVNLRGRLPDYMNNKIIHFIIEDDRLNVFVIEGLTSRQLHSKDMPDCLLKQYDMFKCTRIYPDYWKNY
jgi:hypothetical protein